MLTEELLKEMQGQKEYLSASLAITLAVLPASVFSMTVTFIPSQ